MERDGRGGRKIHKMGARSKLEYTRLYCKGGGKEKQNENRNESKDNEVRGKYMSRDEREDLKGMYKLEDER